MTERINELIDKYEVLMTKYNYDREVEITPEMWVEYFESLSPEGKVMAAEIVLEDARISFECLIKHTRQLNEDLMAGLMILMQAMRRSDDE